MKDERLISVLTPRYSLLATRYSLLATRYSLLLLYSQLATHDFPFLARSAFAQPGFTT